MQRHQIGADPLSMRGGGRAASLAAAVRDERGQSVMVVVVALVSLLGMCALVLDVGYGFVLKRKAQSAADASALAAVYFLPDTSAAQSASDSYATKNFSVGTVTAAFSSTNATNDTITTTASATAPSFFGKVLGFSSYTARATARATVGSYTGYGVNVAPWTIDRASAHLDFGQIVTFKVPPQGQVSPGNFGAVRLPDVEDGCSLGNGTSNYRGLIDGTIHSCLVSVGDTLQSQTGDMGNNTETALKNRGAVQSYEPLNALQAQSNGTYEIKDYKNPNVIVIPVVNAFSNGATTFTVTTFAWFVIKSYNKDTVTGLFVRSAAQANAICPTASNPNNPCPIGARDDDGMTIMQLTG
jgi:Flp pilus assembly protein TadG